MRAVALAGGEARPAPDDEDRLALSCYARAMDHVGVMAADPGFRWLERVVLDLHFDACWFQRDKAPGRYRGAGSRSPLHAAAPPRTSDRRTSGPGLMAEVVDWLEHGERDAHVVVRAAMAHLHVVSVHPFRDGNGRISRIVQSLVLAREGLLAPEVVSIEEYLGRNTRGVLREPPACAERGAINRRVTPAPWLRFCVDAHLATRRAAGSTQIAAAAARWSALESLVARRGWPDRLVVALDQNFFQGTDRASYAAEAGVSAQSATNDLRRLLDAGLVVQRGKGRTTRYFASEDLRGRLR